MVGVLEGSQRGRRTQIHTLGGDLGGFLQRVAFKMHLEGESSNPQIKMGDTSSGRTQPPILFEHQIIATQLGKQHEPTH